MADIGKKHVSREDSFLADKGCKRLTNPCSHASISSTPKVGQAAICRFAAGFRKSSVSCWKSSGSCSLCRGRATGRPDDAAVTDCRSLLLGNLLNRLRSGDAVFAYHRCRVCNIYTFQQLPWIGEFSEVGLYGM